MPDSPPQRGERLGHSFWRMWSAGVIDNLGDGALTVAVGLLATLITHDPRLVAAVSVAATLPWLLISIPAGLLADRFDRVRTMVRAQLLQAIAMAVLTALTAIHLIGIVTLAVLAFLVTSGDVVFTMASQSVLPQLVDKRQLVKANSLNATAQQVSYSFLGQPLGGFLFGTFAALPFGLQTVSYLVSAGMLSTIPRASTSGTRKATSIRADTAEGVRFLGSHTLLRTLAFVLGLNNFANQLGMAILVLFATQTLHVPRAQFGWVLAAWAVGGVLGGVFNTRIITRIGSAAALVVALGVNGVVFLALSAAPNGLVLAALMAVMGFAVTMWNVISVSTRQELVPEQLLGRVNSVYRLLGWGALPLGALAGGFLASWLGLRIPFVAAGALRLLVLGISLPVLMPALRRLRPRPAS